MKESVMAILPWEQATSWDEDGYVDFQTHRLKLEQSQAIPNGTESETWSADDKTDRSDIEKP